MPIHPRDLSPADMRLTASKFPRLAVPEPGLVQELVRERVQARELVPELEPVRVPVPELEPGRVRVPELGPVRVRHS